MRQGTVRGAIVVVAGLVIGLALWLMQAEDEAGGPRSSGSTSAAAEVDAARALPESDSKPMLPDAAVADAAVMLAPGSTGGPGEALRLLGRVVDEARHPIPGALVQHWPTRHVRRQLGLQDAGVAGKPIPWERLPATRTDADGRFALVTRDDVLRGRVFAQTDSQSMDVSLDWMEARPVLVVQHPEHQMTARVVVVAAPGDADVGEIVMSPGTILLGRVVTRSGAPLADVQVAVLDNSGEAGDQLLSRRLLSRAVGGRTGVDGRFRIPGLWCGRFMMFMDAPGTMSDAHPFDIDHAGEFDLGEIPQDAGGRLEGRVVDAQDRPVSGARVRLQPVMPWKFSGPDGAALVWRAEVSGSDHVFGAEVLTGADGSFALISHMNSDHHDVVAHAEGLDPDMAHDVTAGRQNLVLRLQPQASWRLRVVDAENGAPLAGASVRGLRHADDQDEDVSELPAEAVEGGWVLRGASQLRTTAIVSAPGHAEQDFDLPGLPAGTAREQVLRLPREAVIEGRVIDERGAPRGAAAVRVSATGAASGALEAREVSADAQGRFRVGGLRAGEWDLRASVPGALPMFQPRRVALQAGESVELELVLSPGATIAGLVLDAEGSALPGTWLRATTASPEALAALAPPAEALAAATPGRQVMSSSTFTGPDGRFELAGLPPGHWALESGEDAKAEVDLAPRATAEVILRRPRPARLRGRVTRAGRPEPHALVELGNGPDIGAPWQTLVRVTADDAGEYVLERLAAETAFLRASDGLTPSAPILVEFVPGQEQVVDLALPTGHVRGLVVAAGRGEPLKDVVLRLSDPRRHGDDPATQTMRTDGDGRFDFDQVSAGTWLVEAQAQMYCRQSRADVILAEGSDAVDVRFELAPAGMVLVKLDAPAGSETSLRVVLEPLGGAETPQGDAQAGQTLRLSSVPPGSYRLSVQQRGQAGKAEIYHQAITVVAGETLEVRAALGG